MTDADLRSKAEERLASESRGGEAPDAAEALRQVHELQVHQVELEILNEQLAANEELLRRTIDASGLAVWDYDVAGARLHFTGAWAHLLGAAAQTEVAVQEFLALVSAQDRPAVSDTLARAAREGDTRGFCVACQLRRMDGAYIWVEWEGKVSERGADGLGRRMAGTVRDISERKRLQVELSARRKQGEQLHRTQVAAQTAAAFAHEVNQPLASISQYSDAALIVLDRENPDLETLRHIVAQSKKQALRAGDTIRQLLGILTLQQVETERFDLNEEISAVIAEAKGEDQLQFRLVFEAGAGLPPVQANRTHVRQVLSNLLNNAIEAMRDASVAAPQIVVSVEARQEEGVALVRVQDNGPGISQENIDRIFSPFFTTKTQGIGMGLAVSYSLIEANGGRLWVDPAAHPGATFCLTLPLA